MSRAHATWATKGFAIRVTIVVASVVLVGSALYAGLVKPDPQPIPTTSVALDFTGLPNGAVPSHFDGGQPATNSNPQVAPGNQLEVIDGAMTFTSNDPGTVAGYLNTPDLLSPVSQLGATWVFRPGKGTMGAIALVVSQGIRPAIAPMISPISIHLVITPVNWNLAVQGPDPDQPLQVVGEGFLRRNLKTDGTTDYQVTVDVNQGEALVHLPDGTSSTVKDPRISQWEGRYATFEVFANHGSTDANGAFRKVWAVSGGT